MTVTVIVDVIILMEDIGHAIATDNISWAAMIISTPNNILKLFIFLTFDFAEFQQFNWFAIQFTVPVYFGTQVESHTPFV